MKEIVVRAETRTPGSTNVARRLRRERLLPAVVYGGEQKAIPITIDPRDITEILKSDQGQNTLFQLQLGGSGSETVMIYDVQIDPIDHHLVHADLIRITMDKAIEVDVPINVVGEPVGVKDQGGVLDHSLRELRIECLPSDIPDAIDIDVGALEIGDGLRVEDLEIPAGVTVLTDADRSVASVVPPVSEEELEAAVEPLEAELEPGLVGEEEEEAVEGEPAAAEGPPEEKKEEGGEAD